ncbi:maltokinase N-terminal cap-like domain-containing protein [Allostreptomyces psammosilenae]|uniref:Maltokinase n=1 Tax=Allostreptomyces psammosilenae TaxID=1892865 RepID=A0A852ZXM2_9ACTN|nr:maltokinase [Allostreptomyces psammosilenae]NYI06507.1 maltokinase [Allostreptomyces psammosilenae]
MSDISRYPSSTHATASTTGRGETGAGEPAARLGGAGSPAPPAGPIPAPPAGPASGPHSGPHSGAVPGHRAGDGPPAAPPPAPELADGLVRAVLPLLREWLPTQRWFAGKQRPISEVLPLSATRLAAGDPSLLHLLVRVRQEGDGAGEGAVYQVPLGAGRQRPALPDAAVLGWVPDGTRDGLVLFDALHAPALAALLPRGFAEEARLGPLGFRRVVGMDVPLGLPARVGGAEQSNTSVVYGDRLILKLFRRPSPGINPDLELTLALAAAGCRRIATPLGWLEGPLDGLPATLGLLQAYLPDAVDGWELAGRVVRAGGPADRDGVVPDFTAEAYELGRATAEVHGALAETFPVERLEARRITALADAMTRRLEAATSAVPALLPYADAVRAVFADLAGANPRALGGLAAQRIHGDLHLGQAMRTRQGWVLIDFEGEPDRTLTERRRPQPVERDVAAMLRSFDYAAMHPLVGERLRQSPVRDVAEFAAWAADWSRVNRAAYCAGYAAAGDRDPLAAPALLRAFETDKAIYEVVYEARHRPEWLAIPLSAVARIAAERPAAP